MATASTAKATSATAAPKQAHQDSSQPHYDVKLFNRWTFEDVSVKFPHFFLFYITASFFFNTMIFIYIITYSEVFVMIIL